MLDAETKARIDSARDILVGKVPDPKSQVEQITIALIYKFMDDMDRQSEELGGKPSFFTGEFKKYRWAQLLDKRFGGHERLELYREGIEKLNVNKNIPQLFRDIFKGVFLPYRDPETLNLFLKEINGFYYDHSERLGDAFEYLLSVMDSQGAAGQFRTPRHIIDFIVAIVNPQKHETILDPACGTAGFLISSFKHILAQNSTARSGDQLTVDERARLMTNFCGYDISPDMVRLSRVNLYLHGFVQPRIHEYDTLTSEERWDERCDVIMANPPFMTPKGGIRPHSRFSIKANRSEVLFVDYIAEHLNPSGRAGVIVPEGIIFQSQNAYKALRKMLVENYLWAVVSLPAGVFNPYSGVKTSILLFDRSLARRSDAVLFVKVQNDGFDLGAQRRPVEKNDLPEALKILDNHKLTQKVEEGKMALTVSRKHLLESPDVGLSDDRYRLVANRPSGNWPMVKLGDICKLEKGASFTREQARVGNVPVIAGGQVPSCFHSEANRQPPVITVSASGAYAGFISYFELPIFATDCTTIISLDEQKAKTRFVFEILKGRQEAIYNIQKGMAQPHVYAKDLIAMEIPLPPLDEQGRIVAELEGYRKVIEGARQVIANYKPTIKIDPKWPMVKLGSVCSQQRNIASLKAELDQPYIGLENVESGTGRLLSEASDLLEATSTSFVFDQSNVLYGKLRPYLNKVVLPNFRGRCTTELVPLLPSDQIERSFLFWLLLRSETVEVAMNGKTGARMPRTDMSVLLSMKIPLPPLDVQRQIVAELEAERKLVEANRELIGRMEAKIKAKLNEVWGEAAEKN